jgi:hypothetical protein
VSGELSQCLGGTAKCTDPRGGDQVKKVLNTMKVQRLQAVAA